jgi:hypothetical protein
MHWSKLSLLAACFISYSMTAPLAQGVSQQCPGYDGKPRDFSSGVASWEDVDLDKVTISTPTLEVDADRHLKLSFSQIRPICGSLSSHLYAEIWNGPNREEVQLVGIWGAANRPEPARLFEFTSPTVIKSQIEARTKVYLSLDCDCAQKAPPKLWDLAQAKLRFRWKLSATGYSWLVTSKIKTMTSL